MADFQANPAAANEPQTLEEIIQDTIRNFQAEESAKQAANQAGGGISAQPQTAPPAGPAPIKLNIDNQELSFSTAEDAAKYFTQRDERLRAQAQAAISEAQTKAAQAAQPPPTPDTKARDEFRRQFADRLVEDPADATNYALSTALGVQDAASTIRALVGEVLNLRQEGVANTFMARHEDYIVDKNNASALTGILEQRGLPFTVENLELAYSYAKEHNLVKTKEVDSADQQTQQFQSQQKQPITNWNNAPPPRAPQNAAAQTLNGPNLDFDALEQLPVNQLERLIQRLSQAQNAGTLR